MSDKDAVTKAMNTVIACASALRPSERTDFYAALMVIASGLLRASEGDEFVRGMHDAAISDLAMPSETYVQPTRQ